MVRKFKRNVLDAASLLEDLRGRFGGGILEGEVRERRGGVQGAAQARDLYLTLSPFVLRPFVEALFEYDDVAFHAMSARDAEENLTVRCHFSLFPRRRGGRVGVQVDIVTPKAALRLPVLSDLFPMMEPLESQIGEAFGVRFEEVASPSPFLEKRDADASCGLHGLGRRAAIHEIRLGPSYPGLTGPLGLTLELAGEKILEVRLRLLERVEGRTTPLEAEGMAFSRALARVEGFCGDAPFAHALNFVRAAEDSASVSVPPRAQSLRALLGELERLHAHLLGLAWACRTVGIDGMFRRLMRLRERVSGFFEVFFDPGRPFPSRVLSLGGLLWDLDASGEDFLRRGLRFLREEAALLRDVLLGAPALLLRMRDVGVLNRGTVTALGATGPVARGSGLRVDLRKSAPYEGYSDLDVEPVVPQEWGAVRGDVYDRFAVRFMELEQSMRLLFALLEKLPCGPVREGLHPFPESERVGWSVVEAPQGGLFHSVRLRGPDLVSSWDVQPPSCVNAALLPLALEGCDMADVPLIVGSLVPQFCVPY